MSPTARTATPMGRTCLSAQHCLRGHSLPADGSWSYFLSYGQGTCWLKSILKGKWLTAILFGDQTRERARENKLTGHLDSSVIWRCLEKEKQTWEYGSRTKQCPCILQKVSLESSAPSESASCRSQGSTLSVGFYILVLKSCYGGPDFPNLVFKQYIYVPVSGTSLRLRAPGHWTCITLIETFCVTNKLTSGMKNTTLPKE